MVIEVIEPRMQFSRDQICALSKEICTVKTSDRSKINLQKFLYNTAFSVFLYSRHIICIIVLKIA